MLTRFSVTLRGRRNTTESGEGGLAVRLAEQVKRVAVRIRAALILLRRPGSHRLPGGRRQTSTDAILPIFLESSNPSLLGW